MLAGSIIVNLLVFQLSTWKDAIIVAVKGIVDQQSVQTVEVLSMVLSSQNSMVSNLNTLMLIEEGELTLTQIKNLMVFYYCEALKWRTWQTVLTALGPAGFNIRQKHSLQKTVEIHAMAVLKQLATYNKVMTRPEMQSIIVRTIEHVFDLIFGEEEDSAGHATAGVDYMTRVHQVMDIIRVEYDNCAQEIDEYLGKVIS